MFHGHFNFRENLEKAEQENNLAEDTLNIFI